MAALSTLWSQLLDELLSNLQTNPHPLKGFNAEEVRPVVPYVKMILFTDQVEDNYHNMRPITQMLSLVSDNNPLYETHIVAVSLGKKKAKVSPSFESFRLKDQPRTQRDLALSLSQLEQEVKEINRDLESNFYTHKATQVHPYFWHPNRSFWTIQGVNKHKVTYVDRLPLQLPFIFENTPNTQWKKHAALYQSHLKKLFEFRFEKGKKTRWFPISLAISFFLILLVCGVLFWMYKGFLQTQKERSQVNLTPNPHQANVIQSSNALSLDSVKSFPSPQSHQFQSAPRVIFKDDDSDQPLNPAVDLRDPTTRPASPLAKESPPPIPPPLELISSDYPVWDRTNQFDQHVDESDPYIQTRLPSDDEQTQSPYEPPHPSTPLPPQTLAILRAEKGPMTKNYFVIRDEHVSVGRATSCECILPPSGPLADLGISRVHCEIYRSASKWQVRCVSTKGMYINTHRLLKGESQTLNHNDLIYMGQSKLRFQLT